MEGKPAQWNESAYKIESGDLQKEFDALTLITKKRIVLCLPDR